MAFLLLLPCVPAIKAMFDSPLCNALTRCADSCSDCGTDVEVGLMKMSRKFKRQKVDCSEHRERRRESGQSQQKAVYELNDWDRSSSIK